MSHQVLRSMIEITDETRKLKRFATTFAITVVALFFTSCATPGARISQHPDIYQRLSPRDQALVSEGQIRRGMGPDAVWLAWGTPEQKIPGPIRGSETWVYIRYDTPFPSYGVPYYYGPFDWSYIPPKFPYPSRGVTFSDGKVVFFRYLPSPPP
ncbi:MAG TPA: hypothetical protein VFQ83_00885 [Candidatus Udaeobacter sp.]|nr:hypothetical protein [Candidatus Udaeobacter sp.]